jgi:hypothetical protein
MNTISKIILEELQLLNEVVTDIVYHYTNTHNAYKIINTNEFNLSAAMGGSGVETSLNRNKFFFFSLTRSKSTGYKVGDVRLKLDGRKLNQNYKSIPIDYWQYSTNPKDWSSNKEYINRMKTGFEDEDRIVSNKSEIPNAKNYILEVSIRIDKNDNLSFPKRLYLICKQNNIPVFIFQNKNDFNLDNKKNAVNPNELFKNIEDVEDDYKPFRHFANALATLIAYNDDDNKQKIINYLNDDKKNTEFLEELEKRINNNFKIGAIYQDDGLRYINAQIHNMRSSTHPDDKFLLKLLAYDMKKNKVKNTAEYLKLKQWKNKKTIKQFNQEYKEFLLNTIDASISNIIHDQFSKSLEVNQNEYYDHAYEYPSLINQLMNYVNQIKNYISNTIDANEDILNHSYSLSSDEIIRKLNLGQYSDVNNVYLNLNIEYYHHYGGDEAYKNLEYDFKKAIQYLLFEINDKYYDKAKGLLSQYQKQLKENGTLSKSAAEYNFKTQKGIAENNDYRGEHQAPNRDDTPMYDVTNAYGNDFYDSLQKSVRYYGNGTNYDNFSVGLIQRVHNKPNALIKIYRAVPLGITNQEKIEMLEKHKKYILKTGRLPYGVDNWNDKSEYYDFISDKLEKLKELPLDGKVKINSGDWVTINPAYAKEHGIAHFNNKYRILTKTVFAKNLFTDGNSIHEWGYVN